MPEYKSQEQNTFKPGLDASATAPPCTLTPLLTSGTGAHHPPPGPENSIRSWSFPDLPPLTIGSSYDKTVTQLSKFGLAWLAQRKLDRMVDLQALWALDRAFESAKSQVQDNIDYLYYRISRENNLPLPKIRGNTAPERRLEPTLKVLETAITHLPSALRADICIADVGCSVGLLSRRVCEQLQPKHYYAFDLITKYYLFTDVNDNHFAIANNCSNPIQIRQGSTVYKASNGDNFTRLLEAQKPWVEQAIEMIAAHESTGSQPLAMNIISAFSPSVRRYAAAHSNFTLDHFDVLGEAPLPQEVNVVLLSNLLTPEYFDVPSQRSVLQRLAKQLPEGAAIAVVNERYGSLFPFSIFQRQGNSLVLVEYSALPMTPSPQHEGFLCYGHNHTRYLEHIQDELRPEAYGHDNTRFLPHIQDELRPET